MINVLTACTDEFYEKKPYPTGEFAVKRTRLEESTCPVTRSLDIIGDWWSLLIVRDARYGVAVDILVADLTDEAGIRAT
ncbi:hypothetical protein ENINCK417B_00285 [Enterobacter intestinihominis]